MSNRVLMLQKHQHENNPLYHVLLFRKDDHTPEAVLDIDGSDINGIPQSCIVWGDRQHKFLPWIYAFPAMIIIGGLYASKLSLN